MRALRLAARILAIAGVVGIVGLAPSASRADVVDFATCPAQLPACEAGASGCCERAFEPVAARAAIVIPLDRCHQPGAGQAMPDDAAPGWCVPVRGARADDGAFEAYGLAYRLAQRGIPVYWVVNPTKAPSAASSEQPRRASARDVDAWVLAPAAKPPAAGADTAACGAGCSPPVVRLDPRDLSVASRYERAQFPLRGGAFVIAAEDRERFDAFWRRRGEFEGLAGDPLYDFSAVDLYELGAGARFAYQDFRAGAAPVAGGGRRAPVAARLVTVPRLARIGGSGKWLARARLADPAQNYPACLTGAPVPTTAVTCEATLADVRAGYLVQGAFDALLVEQWSDGSPCATAAEIGQHEKLAEFLTSVPAVRPGGHVVVVGEGIGVAEGCAEGALLGARDGGLVPEAAVAALPVILRSAGSLLAQIGDGPPRFGAAAVSKWRYAGGGAAGYASASVVRLVTEDREGYGNRLCDAHVSSPTCDVTAVGDSTTGDDTDVVAYARYAGEADNGVVLYVGGSGDAASAGRVLLGALLALPRATVPQTPDESVVAVSRSAPVIATVGGVSAHYQGTFDAVSPPRARTTFAGAGDARTFSFPHITGDVRAFDPANLGAVPVPFADLGAPRLSVSIPPVRVAGCQASFTSACRTVFTHAGDGSRERVMVATEAAAVLGPRVLPGGTDAEVRTLLSRVLAGVPDGAGGFVARMGGVDRSTLAVVGQSPLTRSERPTMMYVGATDGMLHAICAEVRGACHAVGQELWAFLPGNQLPLLRHNVQRVDGSPKVADVFGDFAGDGAREWRTVLAFQTGASAAGVYALDVTDPTDPRILWEHTTPAQPDEIELGLGLELAMGPVRVGAASRNLVFALTNNGGTGAAGLHLAAIDTITGERVWSHRHAYPAPRDGSASPVPATGIPGGVALADPKRAGSISHIAMPSLYGDVWLLDARDGASVYGDDPLFRFSEDYQPIGASPALYVDRATGEVRLVVASGGHADVVGAGWVDGRGHYAVSVSLLVEAARTPLSELGPDEHGRAFVTSLGATGASANRAFAQPTIVGNELFVVTDHTPVHLDTFGSSGTTGSLHRISLDDGRPIGIPVKVTAGASPADARTNGILYVASGRAAQLRNVAATFDSRGTSAELVFTPTSGRKIWLRLE